MKRVFTRLTKKEFIRNVAILSTGTALSQVLTLAFSPVLTRLYDPDDFGILGVIRSISGPLTVIAALKYELAIVLARDDEKAVNVLVLCFAIVISICLLSALILGLAGDLIATTIGAPSAGTLLLMVPFMVFFGGSFQTLNAWANRRKSYLRASISEVSRSGATGISQVLFALLGHGGGLVYGRIVGGAVATFALGSKIFREERHLLSKAGRFLQLRTTAVAYDQFPKYTMPRALLVAISRNLPTIFLASFFSPAAAGLYWFTVRTLEMPTTLIATAVRRVFYQRAAALHNDHKSVLPLLTRTTAALAAISCIATVIIIAVAPPLFEFIFGSEWRDAGVYAQWLVLWWFAAFCSVPSAMLIPVYDLQRRFFLYEVGAFGLRALAIWLATFVGDDVTAIALYSVVGFTYNIFITITIFYHARNKRMSKRIPVST